MASSPTNSCKSSLSNNDAYETLLSFVIDYNPVDMNADKSSNDTDGDCTNGA